MSEQRLLQRAGKRKLQNRCAALLTVSRLALLPPRVRLWKESHPRVRAAVGCEQTRRSCGRTLHSPASGRSKQVVLSVTSDMRAGWRQALRRGRLRAGAPPRRPAAASPVQHLGAAARRSLDRSPRQTAPPATARTLPNLLPNQAVLPTPTRCAPPLAPSPARRPVPLLVAPLPGVSLTAVAHHRLRHRGYTPAARLGRVTLIMLPDLRHLAHNSSGATRTAATAAALSASSAAGAWSKAGMVAATLGAGLVVVRCSR